MKKLILSFVAALALSGAAFAQVMPVFFAQMNGGSGTIVPAPAGSVPVGGPGTSTDYALAAWNGTTGNLLRDTAVTTDANGDLSQPSTATLGHQLYNTTNQTTDYERLSIFFGSNVAQIGVTKAGVGVARSLQIATGNSAVTFTMQPAASSSGAFNWFAPSSALGTTITYNMQGGTNTATSGSQVGISFSPTYNQGSGGAVNTDLKIARTETALGSGAQAFIDLYAGASGTTQKFTLLNTGKISTYAGIATQGNGIPSVVKKTRVTAQSAANSSICTYTTPAADGSYEVSANMNVTASTTLTTTLTCTYTDESNTARSLILPVTGLTGSFIALGAISGAGASVWETPVMHIRCKASTAITILTSAGTFTGVTYTAEGCIKQTD